MPSFEFESVGTRCGLAAFAKPFPICLFLVFGENRTYIVDTHLGPETASRVRDFAQARNPGKPLVVVNTHAHWDHVWGNCAFIGETIVAHERCPALMRTWWRRSTAEYGDSRRGDIVMTPPTLVFSDRLAFLDDGVELFHTPGHTEDSISVFSRPDSVMFTGDALERPIPSVDSVSPDVFADSLARIASYGADILTAGHDGVVPAGLLAHNTAYLRFLEADLEGKNPAEYPAFLSSDHAIEKHEVNRRMVTINRMESREREKLGAAFDLQRHQVFASEVFEMEPAEIRAAFETAFGL
ncbi:MAG: MBL fold metallo-hydrolase [Spirochaetes bacterium]|nr:MBL fold metallo-hydrolase [Spirochaetota bacterium]